MPKPWSLRLVALAAALAAGLACGCDSGPVASLEEPVQERLAGTWLREYQDQATVVRRVLVLEPGGAFREMSTVTDAGVPPARHTHEGEWLFDGTNLKRRYLRVDGHLPSAPMVPFATFEIRFSSRNEFIGVDNVHKREVRYQRVAEGTVP
jgi:hypothetical protein